MKLETLTGISSRLGAFVAERYVFALDAALVVEEEARVVIDAPWPDASTAGEGAFANEKPRVHVEVLDPRVRLKPDTTYGDAPLPAVDAGPPVDPKGRTLLEAFYLPSENRIERAARLLLAY